MGVRFLRDEEDPEWIASADGRTYLASGFGDTKEEAALDLAESLMMTLDVYLEDYSKVEDNYDNLKVIIDSLATEVLEYQAIKAEMLHNYEVTDDMTVEFAFRLSELTKERDEMLKLLKECRQSVYYAERNMGINNGLRKKINMFLKCVEG